MKNLNTELANIHLQIKETATQLKELLPQSDINQVLSEGRVLPIEKVKELIGERKANIMLAVRHLEDAQFRVRNIFELLETIVPPAEEQKYVNKSGAGYFKVIHSTGEAGDIPQMTSDINDATIFPNLGDALFIVSKLKELGIEATPEPLSKYPTMQPTKEAPQNTIEVIVNGRKINIISQAILTYEELVTLAHPNSQTKNNKDYTVTYSRGHLPEEGILNNGESVDIIHGMIFNVVNTSNA